MILSENLLTILNKQDNPPANDATGSLSLPAWLDHPRLAGLDLEALKRLAANHDAEAQLWLGHLYHLGRVDALALPQSQARGFAWYARAALQRHPGALRAMGAACEHGLGTARDYAKAVKYYEHFVANPKWAEACPFIWHRLGHLYEYGLGVNQDTCEALAYYLLAARYGNPQAKAALRRFTDGVKAGRQAPRAVLFCIEDVVVIAR